MQDQPLETSRALMQKAQDVVRSTPSITVSDLLEKVASLEPTHVWTMISNGTLHCDLEGTPLTEPDKVYLYPAPEYVLAARAAASAALRESLSTVVKKEAGAFVLIDGVRHQIVGIANDRVELLDERQTLQIITFSDFDRLVRDERVRSEVTTNVSEQARELSMRTDPARLKVALSRLAAIAPRLGIVPLACPPPKKCSERTLRRWCQRFTRARLSRGGFALAALIPEKRPGNRTDRLPATVTDAFDKTVLEFHLRPGVRPKTSASYGEFLRRCKSAGEITTMCARAFYKKIEKRYKYADTKAREGHRAAQKFASPQYWHLHTGTPVHGTRPWQVVHIDHTVLDIVIRCKDTGVVLGRPSISLMIDAYTRRILAFYIGFERESLRSVFALVRQCVRRHNRLPEMLIVDNGAAFKSHELELVCQKYEVTKMNRPSGLPRVGSVIERMFGTFNTEVLYQLPGNTQATKSVKQMSEDKPHLSEEEAAGTDYSSIDPYKRTDLLTLDRLIAISAEYFYKVYDTAVHTSLGVSPRAYEEICHKKFGDGQTAYIVFSEDFRVDTMATLKPVTVSEKSGVRIHHFNYWCPEFIGSGIPRSKVPVKVDDWDFTTAYAFVQGQWRLCTAMNADQLKGRTRSELCIATEEIRRRVGRAKGTQSELKCAIAEMLANGDEIEKALLSRSLLTDASLQLVQQRADVRGLAIQNAIEPSGDFQRPPAPSVKSEAEEKRTGDCAPTAGTITKTKMKGRSDAPHRPAGVEDS